MVQKHRISTNIGKEQKVTLELKQDYDLLEILSLKFTQQEAYSSLCADYGVVCGRISVNNGFGVPNARVSIFVPQKDIHTDDPVISKLYPFTSVSDKNDSNYRYNLLPTRKQHGGHTPTGTFPDQEDILTREEILEVYENYYSYTVKTNSAGDFMIWGVPLGQQTIHVDLDLSDIGCFSLRPYDFIRQGLGEDKFKNTYTFKESEDLDSLPQIVSFDEEVTVYPFWGNEDLCEIGITRKDFDLSDKGVKIEPKAYLIGGTYTDSAKNSLNKNCQPRKKMGRKCDLKTKSGKIEAVRFTSTKDEQNRPILEFYKLDEDIPEDGSFVVQVPMNMDYVYTNEFGENEITNDPNKGIPTSACYRFRFSLDDSGNDRVRKVGSYLVPNIRDYQISETESNKSYYFGVEYSGYPTNAISDNSNYGILYNVNGEFYPRDYFYRMTYNKIYTVSSFQNIFYNGSSFNGESYVGIKEILPPEEEDCSSEVVTPPVNFGVKNYTFQLLIADVLLFFEQLINLVTLTFFNTVARVFHALADAVDFWPIRRLSKAIRKFAYRIQDASQRAGYLIIYPECEECNGENSLGTQGGANDAADYCVVGTIQISGTTDQQNRTLLVTGFTANIPNVGVCATTATPVTNESDFISRQTSYMLKFGSSYIDLTSTPFTYYLTGSTFNDANGNFSDYTTYTVEIVDKYHRANPQQVTVNIESGCDIYDTPYDETIVSIYYIGTGRTPSPTYTPGQDVTATNLSDTIDYKLPTGYDGDVYSPITKSGQCEFSNGVFYFVPGSLSNVRLFNILREYRRRKRVGKLFCGGIVNYSFIENWLSGSLYFFQFKGKKGKYCNDVIKYVSSQNRYYYKSGIYTNESNWGVSKTNSKLIGRPTTIVDLGPRDEFIKEICTDPNLDPNCSVSRNIGPSSYQNFGELLGLAINYRMDVSNNEFDINDFFTNGGFKFTNRVFDGDILQLISINNEAGIDEFDLQNPRYLGYSYQFLDPELYSQVFKPNGYWGPVPITFFMDVDGQRVRLCLNEPGRLTESSQKVPFFLWDKKGYGFGGTNEATSDDQSWDYTGVQVQPLQGMTYAYEYSTSPNDPSDKYLLLPITYDFSGLTINTDNATNLVEFNVIKALPDSDDHNNYDTQYPGFTYLYVTSGTTEVPYSGTLYTRYGSAGTWDSKPWDYTNDFIIRKTEDYYTDTKQILSTPFMFYFGLKTGKTGLDKFIKLFGDKGAFTSAE